MNVTKYRLTFTLPSTCRTLATYGTGWPCSCVTKYRRVLLNIDLHLAQVPNDHAYVCLSSHLSNTRNGEALCFVCFVYRGVCLVSASSSSTRRCACSLRTPTNLVHIWQLCPYMVINHLSSRCSLCTPTNGLPLLCLSLFLVLSSLVFAGRPLLNGKHVSS